MNKIKINSINRYICLNGWTYSNQICYLNVQQQLDFDSAVAFCKSQIPTSYLADPTDLDYLKKIDWGQMWVKNILL